MLLRGKHYFVFSSNAPLQLILNFVFQFLHDQWQKPCFPPHLP